VRKDRWQKVFSAKAQDVIYWCESRTLDKILKMIGSSNTKKFRPFQIRWAEKLGIEDNPYLIRWTFIFFGYSMRIHHWIKSDDDSHYHNHSANLLSIVLKGQYWNVKPIDCTKSPKEYVNGELNQKPFYVEGIFNSFKNFIHMRNSIWFSKAEDFHYLRIPKEGAWTLMFEGRQKIKWGFMVNGHLWRPLRYFHKFGIAQTENYQ